jgi:hypothetical protein
MKEKGLSAFRLKIRMGKQQDEWSFSLLRVK